jgi:hypothetical protein
MPQELVSQGEPYLGYPPSAALLESETPERNGKKSRAAKKEAAKRSG